MTYETLVELSMLVKVLAKYQDDESATSYAVRLAALDRFKRKTGGFNANPEVAEMLVAANRGRVIADQALQQLCREHKTIRQQRSDRQ
jgi:hypothetical protein